MNILALGDSFTQGDELDSVSQAWPSQLAGLLQAQVDNRAVSGSGHGQVVAQAVASIATGDYDLVVIGWPNPGRTQFADSAGVFDLWPGMHPDTVGTAQPWRLELLRYYNQYHSDDYIYQQYLLAVILLQSFIRSAGIRAAMTVTRYDNHYANTASAANQQLEQLIDWSQFVGGRGTGMDIWTRNCPHGPKHHFLIQGHAQVAERFYEHIRN